MMYKQGGGYSIYIGGGGSDKLVTHYIDLAKHKLFEHAPPEENYGPGNRVAIFSKVVRVANDDGIDIDSLATYEQSRETQGRGT